MVNQSTFLLFKASYTGTQVGPMIFIQGQLVYILTFIASYMGTQVGIIIFIQGQSVYVLTVHS